MEPKKSQKKIIPLVQSAVRNLSENKIIFYPFCILAFMQLFVLLLLYFSPRYPLNILFGPFIRYFFGEQYLHYPFNFVVLPNLFHHNAFQLVFHVFISSFFVARSIAIISALNDGAEGEDVNVRQIFKETWSSYIHVVMTAALSFFFVKFLFFLFGKVYMRAEMIRSTTGVFALIKTIILFGSSYFYLLISVLGTALFIYMLPIVIIDKKNVFRAFVENFKMLWGSFWFTFIVVLIPSLFFLPVLILRKMINVTTFVPELSFWLLVLSVLLMVVIDAIIYTSITTYYLFKKEENQ